MGKLSNYVRTQDGHNRAPYKLHYRTYVNGYRGGGLRRKGSKSVEICGYQFHSHTAHSTPLPHHFPLKPLPLKLFPLTSLSSLAPQSPLHQPLQKTSKHYCHQQFDHFESQKISNLYRRTQENIHLQNSIVYHWYLYQFSRNSRIVQR